MPAERSTPSGRPIVRPAAFSPLPSTSVAVSLGIVELATVVYQGDAWSAVEAPGPELPALAETKTPAMAAFRNATSNAVATDVAEPPPMEKLMTSTPSATAALIAASRSLEAQMSSVVTSGSGPS
jgi:hypothetical protein